MEKKIRNHNIVISIATAIFILCLVACFAIVGRVENGYDLVEMLYLIPVLSVMGISVEIRNIFEDHKIRLMTSKKNFM